MSPAERVPAIPTLCAPFEAAVRLHESTREVTPDWRPRRTQEEEERFNLSWPRDSLPHRNLLASSPPARLFLAVEPHPSADFQRLSNFAESGPSAGLARCAGCLDRCADWLAGCTIRPLDSTSPLCLSAACCDCGHPFAQRCMAAVPVLCLFAGWPCRLITTSRAILHLGDHVWATAAPRRALRGPTYAQVLAAAFDRQRRHIPSPRRLWALRNGPHAHGRLGPPMHPQPVFRLRDRIPSAFMRPCTRRTLRYTSTLSKPVKRLNALEHPRRSPSSAAPCVSMGIARGEPVRHEVRLRVHKDGGGASASRSAAAEIVLYRS
ncbi:hypothetical protein VTO73DRAFT_15586 [Trametes versicolor]